MKFKFIEMLNTTATLAMAICILGTKANSSDSGIGKNIAIDSSRDRAYFGINGQISALIASSGELIGSIGRVTASTGSCPSSGPANLWCKGGEFTAGEFDGEFGHNVVLAVDGTRGFLYVFDLQSKKLSKISISTGAFLGAIGELRATNGSCPPYGFANNWCIGGTFGSSGNSLWMSMDSLRVDNSNGNAILLNSKTRKELVVDHFSGQTSSNPQK